MAFYINNKTNRVYKKLTKNALNIDTNSEMVALNHICRADDHKVGESGYISYAVDSKTILTSFENFDKHYTKYAFPRKEIHKHQYIINKKNKHIPGNLIHDTLLSEDERNTLIENFIKERGVLEND